MLHHLTVFPWKPGYRLNKQKAGAQPAPTHTEGKSDGGRKPGSPQTPTGPLGRDLRTFQLRGNNNNNNNILPVHYSNVRKLNKESLTFPMTTCTRHQSTPRSFSLLHASVSSLLARHVIYRSSSAPPATDSPIRTPNPFQFPHARTTLHPSAPLLGPPPAGAHRPTPVTTVEQHYRRIRMMNSQSSYLKDKLHLFVGTNSVIQLTIKH